MPTLWSINDKLPWKARESQLQKWLPGSQYRMTGWPKMTARLPGSVRYSSISKTHKNTCSNMPWRKITWRKTQAHQLIPRYKVCTGYIDVHGWGSYSGNDWTANGQTMSKHLYTMHVDVAWPFVETPPMSFIS